MTAIVNQKLVETLKLDPCSEAAMYKVAAKKGDLKSHIWLGICYKDGNGGAAQNSQKAFKWFKKASDLGEAGAQYELGLCYLFGMGTDKNDVLAFQCLTNAANSGNYLAQYKLGCLHLEKNNPTEAFNLFSQAAENGYVIAQYDLALLYQKGKGVKQNDKLAIQWLTTAAERGYDKAQNELGECYYFARNGVNMDNHTAFEWFSKAAKKGHIKAQYHLGQCYKNGYGVPKDQKLSYEWFTKAAEQGSSSAWADLPKEKDIAFVFIDEATKVVETKPIFINKPELNKMLKPYYLSLMSSSTYLNERDNRLPKSWENGMLSGLSNEGYFGMSFVHKTSYNSGLVVIAHRGTVADSAKNLLSDLNMILQNYGICHLTQASLEAIEFSAKVRKTYGKRYTFVETGHSLGGFHAELNAYIFHSKAITFDSPGVGRLLKNPKWRTFLKQEARKVIKSKLTISDSDNITESDYTSYLSGPNLVNTFGTHLGNVIRLFPYQVKEVYSIDNLKKVVNLAVSIWKKIQGAIPFISIFLENRDFLKDKISQRVFLLHPLKNLIEAFDSFSGEPILQRNVSEWPSSTQYLHYYTARIWESIELRAKNDIKSLNKLCEKCIHDLSGYKLGEIIIPNFGMIEQFEEASESRLRTVYGNFAIRFDNFYEGKAIKRKVKKELWSSFISHKLVSHEKSILTLKDSISTSIPLPLVSASSNTPIDDIDLGNADIERANNEYLYQSSDINAIQLEIFKDKGNIHVNQPLDIQNMILSKESILEELNKEKPVFFAFNMGLHYVAVGILKNPEKKEVTLFYKDSYGKSERLNSLKELFDDTWTVITSFHEGNEQGKNNKDCGILALENIRIMINNINTIKTNFSEMEFCNLERASELRKNEFADAFRNWLDRT